MKKFLCVLVLLAVGRIALPTTSVAVATQKQRVVASPSSVVLELAPGESATNAITIVNKGTDPFILAMSAAPYSTNSEESPRYVLAPGKEDASKWVSFTSPEGGSRVDPEQVQEVTYRISVPTTAKAGGHYVALFATTTPDPLPKSVVAHNRIAIICYITVKGDIEQSGRVEAGTFGAFVGTNTLTMPYNAINTGKAHFVAKVSAVIKTVWGKDVSRLSDERYVLPGTEKQITLDWQTQGAFGIYRLERSVEYLGRVEQLPPRWLVVAQPAVLAGIALVLGGAVLFVIFRLRRH